MIKSRKFVYLISCHNVLNTQVSVCTVHSVWLSRNMNGHVSAHVLPSTFFFIFPVSFLITFMLSLQFNHVKLLIPYISDTGDSPPESSVFSLLVNVCSAVLAICIYIRHLQIIEYTFSNPFCRVNNSLNSVATAFGLLSSVGLMTVANFQETHCYYIHFFGALTCIWSGSVYLVLQTWISYCMKDDITYRTLLYIRCFFCTLIILFNIIGIISTVTAITLRPTDLSTHSRPWEPDDQGWAAHVISAVSEWVMALLQSSLVFSFVPELKSMNVIFPVLKITGISCDT